MFRHLYVRECLRFNMEKKPSRADLISMLYSETEGEKRKILHEEVLAAWELTSTYKEGEGEKFGLHLHKNLQHMLNNYPNEMGGFMIWMTIRCRKAEVLVERGSKALKQFLTHLEKLVNDPFLRSAASEAVIVNDKFSSKSNYFAMFQLERVRLLRAGVKMDNNNLEQAVKILHAIEIKDDGDEYGGIYVPSSAMEATKWLQLALCSSRTANHGKTIDYAREVAKELDKNHARSFSNVKRVFEWWAMKIEERVVSSYSGKNLQKEGRKKMIAFEKNTLDKDTKQYLIDMKKKNEENRGMVGYKTWSESNDIREDLNNTILYDFMYVKHSVLSAFINSPYINPKRKFDKVAVEKVMKDSGDRSIAEFFEENQPNTRKRRKNANNLLSNIVTGRVRKRNGLARIGLLLDHTIFTSKKKWVKYLLGSASSSILHAHAAVERDMRMQPAVLAMIGIDVCAQISHLGSFALSRKKKGWYSVSDLREGVIEWKCIDDGDTKLLASRLIETFEIICRGIKNSIGKDCGEINIYQWAQSTLETLKIIRDEMDSKLKFTKIIELCQRSIGWADYIEMEKFKNKLKNYMSEEFEEWSTERSELFIEVFFNEINDVADNLQCDVEQFKQAFIHLSKKDDWGYGVRELFTNLCKCEKKKIQHDESCVLSGSKMEILFEKLGITNAVDCRELSPIYLRRVSLIKEEGWKIKTTLCDDVFLARNTRANSEEGGLPLTRYQRSPAESHR
jgi:hypothetical protein